MADAKRYEMETDWMGNDYPAHVDDGEWVKYDDHARIVAEQAAEIERLRSQLAEHERRWQRIDEERIGGWRSITDGQYVAHDAAKVCESHRAIDAVDALLARIDGEG